MADQFIPGTDESVVRVQRAALAYEYLDNSHLDVRPNSPMMGLNGDQSKAFVNFTDLHSRAGEEVQQTLQFALQQVPRAFGVMEGNEVSTERDHYKWKAGPIRGGSAIGHFMTEQRVPYSVFRNELMEQTRWLTHLFWDQVKMHLAGYGPTTSSSTAYLMAAGTPIDPAAADTDARAAWVAHNTPVTPDDQHIVRWDESAGNGTSITDDANIPGNADSFPSIEMFRHMVDLAREGSTTRLRKRPCLTINGKDLYKIYCDTNVWAYIRKNDPDYASITSNLLESGYINKHPFFTGAAGMTTEGALICPVDRMPPGVSNAGAPVANTSRAVLVGACALWISWIKGYGPNNPIKVVHGHNDGKMRKYVHVNTAYGIASPTFTRESDGTQRALGKIVATVRTA